MVTLTREELEILIERLAWAVQAETDCLERLKEACRQVELSRGILRASEAALGEKLAVLDPQETPGVRVEEILMESCTCPKDFNGRHVTCPVHGDEH